MATKTNLKPAPKPATTTRQTGRVKPMAAPGGFRGNRKRYDNGGKS